MSRKLVLRKKWEESLRTERDPSLGRYIFMENSVMENVFSLIARSKYLITDRWYAWSRWFKLWLKHEQWMYPYGERKQNFETFFRKIEGTLNGMTSKLDSFDQAWATKSNGCRITVVIVQWKIIWCRCSAHVQSAYYPTSPMVYSITLHSALVALVGSSRILAASLTELVWGYLILVVTRGNHVFGVVRQKTSAISIEYPCYQ